MPTSTGPTSDKPTLGGASYLRDAKLNLANLSELNPKWGQTQSRQPHRRAVLRGANLRAAVLKPDANFKQG